METLGTVVVVSVLVGGILWIARLIAVSDDPRPSARPSWLGPDPVAIEAALSAALEQLGRELGVEPLQPHPAIQELARHHAFDMGTRNFRADSDPEGVDHPERRRRLHPEYVGRTWQWLGEVGPAAGGDPASLASGLIASAADELGALLEDGTWSQIGVGVGTGQGSCAVCVVLGDQWATLDSRPTWGPDEGWVTRGRVVEGTQRHQLAVQRGVGGVVEQSAPASSEPGWDDDQFALQIAVSDPNKETWLEITRSGASGLRRLPG